MIHRILRERGDRCGKTTQVTMRDVATVVGVWHDRRTCGKKAQAHTFCFCFSAALTTSVSAANS